MGVSRRIVFPLLTFCVYLFLSRYLLSHGHPHEDAYILYIYAENLASGHGIAYYPGAAPAEGATDFLWMVLLAAGIRIGFDVAIAASLLNGFGLAVVHYLILAVAGYRLQNWRDVLPGVTVGMLLLSSSITVASLAGFSTGFYCAFVALVIYMLYQRNPAQLPWLPLIGLVLGLLRPDGVLIGVTAVLVGLYPATLTGVLRRYLWVAIGCALGGVTYFAWRYGYFGHLLPLPLYVKSAEASTLPGIVPNIVWAVFNFYMVLLVLLALPFMKQRGRVLLAALPVVALFAGLMFAIQGQNVAHRFQAPGVVLLFMIASLAFFCLWRNELPRLKRTPSLLLFALLLFGSLIQYTIDVREEVTELETWSYINSFPFHLAEHVPADTTVALTEAGKFAYWLPGRKYDLVGLNTPATALNKVSPDYIQRLDPDLVFVHAIESVDLSEHCPDKDFCPLTLAGLQQARTTDETWQEVDYGVFRAPLAFYRFLAQTPTAYRLYTVSNGGKYNHLFAVKLDGAVAIADFEQSLKKSFAASPERSYLALKARREDLFAHRGHPGL